MVKKDKLIVLLFLLNILVGYGQTDKEKKANKAIFNGDYKVAANYYEDILKSAPENFIAKKNIVDLYLTLGDNENAEKWLGNLAKQKKTQSKFKRKVF